MMMTIKLFYYLGKSNILTNVIFWTSKIRWWMGIEETYDSRHIQFMREICCHQLIGMLETNAH